MNRGGAQYRRWGSGSSSSTTTATTNKSKAKCASNQDALDRLWEARKKMEEQNPSNNYGFALRRAMKSLADCTVPVTTFQEAMALKYVGRRLARVICPLSQEDAANPNAQSNATDSQSTVASNKRGGAGTIGRRTVRKTQPAQTETSRRQVSYETAKKAADELVLPRAPWRVILLIDGREPKSKHMIAKCQQSGIPSEERHLPIGDMAWIAQCSRPNKPTIEVMCGTIMERKEVNDLAHSLFGSRYLEQRLRLHNSGLPQILFLVEGNLSSCRNCPADTLEMAMMETRIQLGFDVVRTKHVQDTVNLLKGLHRRIVQRTFPDVYSSNASNDNANLPSYGAFSPAARRRRRQNERRATSLLELVFDTPPKPPFGMDRFMTYSELKFKIERDREAGTKTIGAISLAMLKQVATFSNKKCFAISQVYPTFKLLLQAYAASKDPELMVQEVPCGQQKIGPKSAKELHIACCMQADGTIRSTKINPYRSAPTPPPIQRKPPPRAALTPTESTVVASARLRQLSRPSEASSPLQDFDFASPSPVAFRTTVDLTEDTPLKPVCDERSTRAETQMFLTPPTQLTRPRSNSSPSFTSPSPSALQLSQGSSIQSEEPPNKTKDISIVVLDDSDDASKPKAAATATRMDALSDDDDDNSLDELLNIGRPPKRQKSDNIDVIEID